MKVVDRFLQYVRFSTTSDAKNEGFPSTQGQRIFAKALQEELIEMGLQDVSVDENGYLMATLPSNLQEENLVSVGFISHLDTAPAFNGDGVSPQIIRNYDGKDIPLNGNITLKVADFPEIQNYISQDIITSDGTTLLGADDKAGIAEIITAVEYLKNHDTIPRPTIKIAFTPDEEIGRGAERFDVEKFGAHYAYTIDGGPLGELQYENFNAAYAKITIQGRNIHPGEAKGKMVNAILLAIKLNDCLPKDQIPSKSEKKEGFYHICDFNGNEEKCEMYYIIRDFDKDVFEKKKKYLLECIDKLNAQYDRPRIQIQMKDQYYNMKEKIVPVIHIVEKAMTAMKTAGVEPVIVPIRGGTDGASLSYKGLPTPNIFTGGHNFHGRYEYIPIPSMEKAVEVIINIAKEVVKDSLESSN